MRRVSLSGLTDATVVVLLLIVIALFTARVFPVAVDRVAAAVVVAADSVHGGGR